MKYLLVLYRSFALLSASVVLIFSTLIISACASPHPSSASQTLSELGELPEKIESEKVKSVTDDYSGIYKKDGLYIKEIKEEMLSISPQSAMELFDNIAGYNALHEVSLINAASTRAIYTYPAKSINECISDQKELPLRSYKKSGQEYLVTFLLADVDFRYVDGVILSEMLDAFHEPIPDAIDSFPMAEKMKLVGFQTKDGKDDMFCQPLELQYIAPAVADLKNLHPSLYGANAFFGALNSAIEAEKLRSWAKGQYIPVSIWALLKNELGWLEEHVSFPYSNISGYPLVIDYSTDDFSMKVDAKKRRIVISAVLIRHAVLMIAMDRRLELNRLEESYRRGLMNDLTLKQKAGALALSDRQRLREIFSLALAHELAHIYLGKNGEVEFNEERVDCYAVSNVYRSRKDVPMGLIGWMKSDMADEAYKFWAIEDQHYLSAINARIRKITEIAESPSAEQNQCN